MKHVHLVFPGCGTRYPYLIGAVKAMEDRKISPVSYVGTSGGGLVAAIAAAGYDSEQMATIANRFLPKQVFGGGPLHMLFAGPMGGWFGGKKILKVLDGLLPDSFKDLEKPLFIVTHDVSIGFPTVHCAPKYEYMIKPSPNFKIATDTPLHTAVRATMSIPLMFDAVKIKKHWHEDGGISVNDFRDLLAPGRYDTIGFSFQVKERRKPRPIKSHADRVGYLINDMINAAAREHIEDAHWSKTVLIRDTHPGFDPSMTSQDISNMISIGYKDTLKFLKK